MAEAPRITQAWCPACREWTVLDPGQPCAWCDTILVKRKGGWKRPDRQRFSRADAEAIHAAHMQGVSLRAIARQLAPRLGYASEHSALETIRTTLHREGLAVRSQGAATAASNRARPTVRLPGETKNELKARRRRERGYVTRGRFKVASKPYQPRATTTT